MKGANCDRTAFARWRKPPPAIGSTLAQEQTYPVDVWRKRALGASYGCDRATFVAEIAGTWIGAVTGLANLCTPANGVPLHVAMFVAESERRSGVGVGLVDAAATWAKERGATRTARGVTLDKASAVTLNQRRHFCFSGAIRPRSHAAGHVEKEKVRQLQ
jgi:GNAT superfamily N-acetyltransferase